MSEELGQTDIVTVTLNPAIDKYTSVDQVTPEEKLRCSEPTREPGGGGLNVSRAIRFLGGSSLAIWARGGPLGELLQGLLEAEEIPHHPIPISGTSRENLIVEESSTGKHYRFGMPGPKLSSEEVERFLEIVPGLEPSTGFVVASGSLPPGADDAFYARLARAVAERGVRLVLDTSGKPLRIAVREAGVYLLKPNLRELRGLMGRALETDTEIIQAGRDLVEQGCCRVVVVSLGTGGAILVTADRVERIAAPTVPIRSRIGAGDSMVAGLVLALSRGEPVERAARFGVAAGSAAVMTPGTRLCRRAETEELFETMTSIPDVESDPRNRGANRK